MKSSPEDADPRGEVVIAQVNGVFGIKGEVRIFLFNPEGETLLEPRPVVLVGPDGTRRPATLSIRAGAGKRILGRISGVDTPEAAAALKDWFIHVDRASMPEAEEGSWYLHDIIGLPVETEDGTPVGTLDDVFEGERDIWAIGEHFVLASAENVVSVDLEGRKIVIRAAALSE